VHRHRHLGHVEDALIDRDAHRQPLLDQHRDEGTGRHLDFVAFGREHCPGAADHCAYGRAAASAGDPTNDSSDTRADADGSSILSEAGSIMGTPRYLAPEAITSPQNVGPSSDIYSLGALMYFLLVGPPVFEGRTSLEVCFQHRVA
jgi:serine/threonine protein kinase